MNARNVLFLSLLSCALTAPGSLAQYDKEPPKPVNARFGDPTAIGRNIQGDIYGVVKKVEANEIVLDKTKFGVDTSIRVDGKTKYIRDRKTSSPGKLNMGDAVYVTVKTEKKTGVMTAKKITSGVIATP